MSRRNALYLFEEIAPMRKVDDGEKRKKKRERKEW